MSSDGLTHVPIDMSTGNKAPKPRGRPKGVKNRVTLKVLSPGSASVGAGALLKRLRISKKEGKGRNRCESSPIVRNGKRPNSSNAPVDDVLSKVLDKIAYDKKITSHMVFREGSNTDASSVKNDRKLKSYCSIGGNDGSFINSPIEPIVSEMEVNRDGIMDKVDGLGVNGDPMEVSNNTSKPPMADEEHGKVENVGKTSKDVKSDVSGRDAFVFGDVKSNKGILNNPPVGKSKVQFGPSLFYSSSKPWSASKVGVNAVNIESFAEKMKKGVEDRELQMQFVPQFVSTQSDGTKRIAISVEDIKKGSVECALQLFGYFVGTSMDYRIVNANLSRMWRAYGIADITKTSAGLFYFKFNNEEGMKAVLESGPWMVNNISLVLNIWEPGIWLEKVEPSTIPIWVCVYGIPMELCNGNGIGKIMSGIGKPMLMDKLTRERCLKKSGKLDFARVLVEVSASDVLPHFLEIEYPALGDRPGRVGKLELKYQWKPPQCTHCKTFGHSTAACKVRPRTDDEIATKILKETLNVSKVSADTRVDGKVDNDGFTTVGKNNKPVGVANNVKQNSHQFRSTSNAAQNRGFMNGGRSFSGYGNQKGGNKGPNQQSRNVNGGSANNQSISSKAKGSSGVSSYVQKTNLKSAPEGLVANKSGGKKGNDKNELVSKPALMSKYDANYKPKVLVRGSSSKSSANTCNENVPVSNSYQVLDDQDMVDKEDVFLNSVDEEFLSSVWPKLKSEVEEVFQSGVYPSQTIRSNWSLHQLEYFYNNCAKFGMDASVDDEDVLSENEGMAVEMKPGNGTEIVPEVVNNGTNDNTAINKRLNTQDKVAVWIKVDLLKCPLCSSVMDNHDHLFFDCDFSVKVWNHFKRLMRFEDAPNNLFSVIDILSSRTMGKSIWNIIQRLVLSAVVYHLWIERNNRIFQNKSRSFDDLCSIIREVVRLRLLSLKIKGSKNSIDAAKIWDFQVQVMVCLLLLGDFSYILMGSGISDIIMVLLSSNPFDKAFLHYCITFYSWTVLASPVWCNPSLDDIWNCLYLEIAWCSGYSAWCVPSTDDAWIFWLRFGSLYSGPTWSDLRVVKSCCYLVICCLKGCFSIFFLWRNYGGSLVCSCLWVTSVVYDSCLMARRFGDCFLFPVFMLGHTDGWITQNFIFVEYKGYSEWLLSLMVFWLSWSQMVMDYSFEGLKANCILVGVPRESCSLFPYPGFVPMGFSREGFLRRQSPLVKCSKSYISDMFPDSKMKLWSLAIKLKFMLMMVRSGVGGGFVVSPVLFGLPPEVAGDAGAFSS
ncbi:hypothetical protein CTI12_AA080440 [Artemisia annua]|uniref:Uncharacterized protein n=1 Tax=Artemisia annua TaxID=35608 RepID=A0A2U1P2R6_ARTAN|nr:hypothetical protein CTI12_AA080440 [Artemisia annua]